MQPVWLFIPSLGKYQRKATNVTMYCFTYTIWSDICMMAHNGEKSYNCTQCNCASYEAGNFKKHLRTHTGKTPTNATNAIMHPFNHTNNLRTHLKTYSGSNRNATNVTIPVMILWWNIWKDIVEKINATNVTIPPMRHALWKFIWKCITKKN